MIANPKLHAIQTGDLSADEARKVIREFIQCKGVEAGRPLRTALRGWTWKALQTRRTDASLTEWYQIIRTASALLEKQDPKSASYIEALAQLIEESVRYAAMRPRVELKSRTHVAELLDIVDRHGGHVRRTVLETESGLRSSRLSQLLTELSVSGALDREADGRRASFRLTGTGKLLLEELALQRSVAFVKATQTTKQPAQAKPTTKAEQGTQAHPARFALAEHLLAKLQADWVSTVTLSGEIRAGAYKEAILRQLPAQASETFRDGPNIQPMNDYRPRIVCAPDHNALGDPERETHAMIGKIYQLPAAYYALPSPEQDSDAWFPANVAPMKPDYLTFAAHEEAQHA